MIDSLGARAADPVPGVYQIINDLHYSVVGSEQKFADDTKLFGAVDEDTHRTFNATEGFITSMSVVRNVADARNTSPCTVFSERQLTFTFDICYRPIARPSVVCMRLYVVCNVYAPHSAG